MKDYSCNWYRHGFVRYDMSGRHPSPEDFADYMHNELAGKLFSQKLTEWLPRDTIRKHLKTNCNCAKIARNLFAKMRQRQPRWQPQTRRQRQARRQRQRQIGHAPALKVRPTPSSSTSTTESYQKRYNIWTETEHEQLAHAIDEYFNIRRKKIAYIDCGRFALELYPELKNRGEKCIGSHISRCHKSNRNPACKEHKLAKLWKAHASQFQHD